MLRPLMGFAALAALFALLPSAAGAERLDEAVLANRIDARIAASWKANKVTPAVPTDDAEFVRRIYLDLTGRIPDILEARDFLDNPDRNKRAKLVEQLVNGERYPVHFANVWATWWLPESNATMFPVNRPYFEQWLRNELKSNAGYHKMVQAVMTGRSDAYGANISNMFAQAHGLQPESMAGATTRLFLGVRLECAQCHNHPFARWNRKQFWEIAAFYNNGAAAALGRGRGGLVPPGAGAGGREIEIPGTGKRVSARFLDGTVPTWKDGDDPRVVLSEWMTSPSNPYFARAAVNRLWEHFLGTGLFEPVDEGGPDNPASHPEILDELTEQFTAHGFDLKYLIRTILLTNTYQLTSKQTHSSQTDPRHFARMKVRGLTPAQLYDSLALATGQPEARNETFPDPRFAVPTGPRIEFLRRFPNQDKRTDQKTSILQALYLMNGELVADATSLEHNKNLAIIAEATTVRTSRRIEQLYLITLNRKPKAEESARLVKYVDAGGPTANQKLALCDVFWALLNCSEFSVNH